MRVVRRDVVGTIVAHPPGCVDTSAHALLVDSESALDLTSVPTICPRSMPRDIVGLVYRGSVGEVGGGAGLWGPASLVHGGEPAVGRRSPIASTSYYGTYTVANGVIVSASIRQVG
jgi:hypothetical protein